MGNSNIQPKWYEQYVKKYKLVQNYMMDTVLDYTKNHIISSDTLQKVLN